MRVREAKDFLVQQVSLQAQLEGIELSDLEKRMLYFTEGSTAVEDPVGHVLPPAHRLAMPVRPVEHLSGCVGDVGGSRLHEPYGERLHAEIVSVCVQRP